MGLLALYNKTLSKDNNTIRRGINELKGQLRTILFGNYPLHAVKVMHPVIFTIFVYRNNHQESNQISSSSITSSLVIQAIHFSYLSTMASCPIEPVAGHG